MTNTPSETEIDNLLCKHWPGYSRQAVLVKMWLREAIESAIAKWAAPQPQAGAVPQGWKAVPVNPTPEMWKAAKTVPDPNPPYPPHYGLVWDAMLAASPTPPAVQQAAPQPAPAPLSESIAQVERALAIIGVVGAIDGHDVVRRESVLEIARRAAIAAQGGKDA